jgi:hypothetical protein
MKTRKLLMGLLGTLCFYTLITSSKCKKDEDPPPEPTTAQKIQARWTFVNADYRSYNHNTNALLLSQTIPGLSGDYFEFRSTGRVVFRLLGTVDSSDYAVIDNNRFVIIDGSDRDTASIQTLTATDFKFKLTEIDRSLTPPERDETTFNLRK